MATRNVRRVEVANAPGKVFDFFAVATAVWAALFLYRDNVYARGDSRPLQIVDVDLLPGPEPLEPGFYYLWPAFVRD